MNTADSPTWAALFGSAPNYTLGMDATRYLTHNRGECPDDVPCALCLLERAEDAVTPVPVVGEANASDRTAPRRRIDVDRAVIVNALDAWQQYNEVRWADADASAEWDQMAEAMAELNAEVQG